MAFGATRTRNQGDDAQASALALASGSGWGACRQFLDRRNEIQSPSYIGRCPVAALRQSGYRAWIETERDLDGHAYDVLFTDADQGMVNFCAGHGLAFTVRF